MERHNQKRQRVKLTHPNGTEFVVFLTEYEINKAETDPAFLQEILEKYYTLHNKDFIGGSNETSGSPAINYEIDTDFDNSHEEALVENKLPVPGKIWTDTNIRVLLELCKKFDQEFETSIKKLVWKKIAKILSEGSHTTITWSQCDTKFKGLKDYYKSIKKHNDTSGNNFKYWCYYDLMDELLGKKPEIMATFTCSSAKGLRDVNKTSVIRTEITSSNDDSDVENKSKGNVSSAFEMLNTKKRKREVNVAERRHQEKMIRQDRYLNLFERLVVSLETKVD